MVSAPPVVDDLGVADSPDVDVSDRGGFSTVTAGSGTLTLQRIN
jgi:hypothetical protein